MATDEEKRAYSRGYAAGQKRTAAEEAKWVAVHAEMHSRHVARRDQLFCAALSGLIVKGGWTMDGKPLGNMDDYVELARRFADKSLMKLPP